MNWSNDGETKERQIKSEFVRLVGNFIESRSKLMFAVFIDPQKQMTEGFVKIQCLVHSVYKMLVYGR